MNIVSMHEYAIIVPQTLEGASQVAFNDRMATILLNAFGGFTMVPVKGAWRDSTGKVFYDASIEYRVGIAGGLREAHKRVQGIAYNIGVTLAQECMYIKCPNGACEIISTNK